MFRLWHFHQSLFCLRSLKHSMPDWPHVMLQQTFPVCFSIFVCLAFLWACETQRESSLILGSLHLIQYQAMPFPCAVRKTTRLLFSEHWITISREGYIWEIANFLFLQTLLPTIYTVFIYMDLCESIIYVRQRYLFLSVKKKKKSKGYEMAEDDKQTILQRLKRVALSLSFI